MPEHLTTTAIARAELADGTPERTIWDGRLAGFGVRIRPGKRTFIVQYRTLAGTQRKVTVGAWPSIELAEARRRAKKILGAVSDGKDPAAEKQLVRDAGTIAALLDRSLAEHWAKRNKPSSVARVGWMIDKIIKPQIGKLATADVSTADMERLRDRLENTPRQANLALATLSRAFTLAERWGVRPKYSNPCARVERFPEKARQRVPTPTEYAALASELDKLESERSVDPAVAGLIRFLALTGLRLGEARTLRWRQVDIDNSRLRLEDAKTGARDVPIGAVTLAMLAALPRQDDDADRFVFGAGADPLTQSRIAKAWQRIRAPAGCTDLRIHDLRHGVGTQTALAGANVFQVKAKLGHKTVAMATRYVNQVENYARALSDRVEGAIDGHMRRKTANVVRVK